MTSPTAEEVRDCAEEPIHIPGAIQPHGALITFSEEAGTIQQVSSNLPEILGSKQEEWTSRPLEECIGLQAVETVRGALVPVEPTSPIVLQIGERSFDVVLHRADEVVILELEPLNPDDEGRAIPLLHQVLSRALRDLQAAQDLPGLCAVAAQYIAEISGFERVMVYRFDRDWHGEVIGEVRNPEVDSYMGLHFPATDIPEQARQLYLRNLLRLIASSSYTPARLEPAANPRTGRPLDLSHSTLRSVSPVHLEYLRNMRVGGSMSVSLVRDGKLWGLIACHHRQPTTVSFSRRAACQLVGQIMATQIAVLETFERQAAKQAAQAVQGRFLEHLANSDRFLDALTSYTPELLSLLRASGAAVVIGDRCTLLGNAPPEESILGLLKHLRLQPEPIFSTESLCEIDPAFDDLRAQASGVLSVSLSELRTDYIMWFRPEVLGTVTWAGNPQKAVQEGSFQLHPRSSFSAWQQIVTGHCERWADSDLSVASELRTAINASIFKRYDRFRRLNEELERKNSDLDSFAYIASHDLKEPIRGIRNYATFIEEDCGDKMDAESLRRLRAIKTMSERSNEQLDALLHFSQVGQRVISLQPIDMTRAAQESIEMVAARAEGCNASISVARGMPPALADGALMREIFTNLIGNALKYTDGTPQIVIGFEEPELPGGSAVYFVSDDGIGIPEHLQQEVFRVFRRLHALGVYGGGTGVGLAVVKSIVERHNGHVWLKSQPGKGTTFFFTIGN